MKNILFIYFTIFLLIFVFINNLIIKTHISLLVLFILGVFFLLYYLLSKKHLIVTIICIIWALVWILVSYHHLEKINQNTSFLSKYYDKKETITLEILNTSKIGDYNIEYIAKLKKLWDKKIDSNIKVLVKTSKNNSFEKWYIIKTDSKIREIKNFEGFSYKYYMLSKNIYFSTVLYNYELIKQKELNFLESNIIKIRKTFLDAIYEIYPKEEAIFLWWILFGARESLPKDLQQDFNNSWLTHFIAVSWFNITILVVFFSYLLKYFPIFLRIIIITFFIFSFTLLVWDTAPVVRASIMWLIWYYIISSGRKANSISIILFTALIMILISPLSINYDISMHLSFLAVLWIIYTQKFFERIFYFLPNFLEIKMAFCLTLSAMSLSLPIIVLNFGQMSILSPLANIAVSWTIPIAMLFGFISTSVYFVHNILWICLWYMAWILLKWDIMVVHFFWKQEWSLLQIDLWVYKYHFELLYFIILIFLILWFREKNDAA